nr:hypothetical protein [Tanacetum cinerariifolium]
MLTPTFAETYNLIAFLEKPTESDRFEQIVDFLNVNPIKYVLTVSPTIYTSCIKQFWTYTNVKTVNEDVRLQALVDGKKVIVNKASIRHDLRLDDAEAVDSCKTAQEIWLRVQQMMKGSDIGIQEKKAKLFNEWESQNRVDMLLSFIRQRTCIQLITLNLLNQDQPSFNKNCMQQPMPNPKDITDPTTAMNMALALMAKAFKLNYSTPTNNNQRISSNPPRAEENASGHNGNQIRCYNYRGVGHFARNSDLDEIEKVNANFILMANLQQASTSGTQTNKAPIYDSNGSAEVHDYENCDDNEILNIFTQEEQYAELLELIPEPHQVPQNDNYILSEVTSREQSGETIEQHPANFKETRALYDSLYQNLAIKVEKVNTINCKLKETNIDLTTELARFKNQEKCFEISQEKYDKLERYLNKQLSKEKSTHSFLLEEKKKLKSDFKICEDELLDKQIQLEKNIKELNNILVKTGQSIQMIHMLSPKPDSFYHTKQKMALGYQNLFYLKQAQKKQQSLYDGKVLLEKHDPPVVYDSEEILQLA